MTNLERWFGKVALGYVYGNIAPEFTASLTDVLLWDKSRVKNSLAMANGRMAVAKRMLEDLTQVPPTVSDLRAVMALLDQEQPADFLDAVIRVGGCYVAQNRNSLAEMFLQNEDENGGAEALLLLDADMVLGARVLPALLQHLDPVSAPIIAGLYFTLVNGRHVFSWWRKQDNGEYEEINQVNPGLNKIDGFATGCALIHRSVFQKMRDHYKDQWVWFAHDPIAGRIGESYGEDIGFSRRAQALDIPMFGCGDVILGHMKTQCLTLTTFKEWQALQALRAKK